MEQIMIARCGNGRGPCRANVVVDVDEAGFAVFPFLRYFDGNKVAPCESRARAITVASAWCLAHRQPMIARKIVRGVRTTGECGSECREATGATCKCACAGTNHGVDAQ